MTILDTHVWIWFLLGESTLPAPWRDQIAAQPEEAAISAISVWELLVLADKGRLRLEPDPVRFVRDALKDFPLRVLPLTPDIVIASRELPFEHEDPADRFIAATTKLCQARLMTCDRRLESLAWLETVPRE